jgi:ribonuclease H / adenosylcobalamin/alpha-ribazole phosphatase
VRVTVWSDGAARGNPGPAGIGAVVANDDGGEILARVAEGIGVATNNVAEYRAAIAGLRAAADLGADAVTLKADSRLLIEQLRGKFRVKNPTLQVLHAEARKEIARFVHVRLVHVARELNKAADKAANEGVDAWLMSNLAPEPEGPDPLLWE